MTSFFGSGSPFVVRRAAVVPRGVPEEALFLGAPLCLPRGGGSSGAATGTSTVLATAGGSERCRPLHVRMPLVVAMAVARRQRAAVRRRGIDVVHSELLEEGVCRGPVVCDRRGQET